MLLWLKYPSWQANPVHFLLMVHVLYLELHLLEFATASHSFQWADHQRTQTIEFFFTIDMTVFCWKIRYFYRVILLKKNRSFVTKISIFSIEWLASFHRDVDSWSLHIVTHPSCAFDRFFFATWWVISFRMLETCLCLGSKTCSTWLSDNLALTQGDSRKNLKSIRKMNLFVHLLLLICFILLVVTSLDCYSRLQS